MACPANWPAELVRITETFGWVPPLVSTPCERLWKTAGSRTAETDGTLSFPEASHSDLQRVEDNSLWFRHRNTIIGDAIKAINGIDSVWEVGSGNGIVASYLNATGLDTIAVEPGLEGARYSAEQRRVPTICGRFEELQLPDCSINCIGAFDVIEHLADPRLLLKEFHRCLVPGGTLIISVPACSWLWSDVDEFSGHFCRYDKSTLVKLLEHMKFKPTRCQYFMFPYLLPLFAIRTIPYWLGRRQNPDEIRQRAISNLASKETFFSRVGSKILEADRCLFAKNRVPVGTSILALATKC